jgi:putative membrane protein
VGRGARFLIGIGAPSMLAVAAVAAVRTGEWPFHLHADVFAVTATLVILYVQGLRRLGPRYAPAGQPVATVRQRVLFGIGALLLFAAASWPMHDIAEDYLFSVHMTEHFILSLIAVPILLLGTPAWLLSWIVRLRFVRPVARRLVRPLPASLLYNGVVAISHAAFYVNYTSSHELAHFAAHALLVLSAAVMWLPVCHQLPELKPMSAPVRMVYLFAQSLLPNVPAVFLAFAETPLYSWYAVAPRISAMSAVEDQQLAGAIMKIGGTLLLWTIIVVQFFRWYQASEQSGSGPGDVLTWEDVERELARTPPPKVG